VADDKLLIYGVAWCVDCRRAQKFLQSNKIAYEFINIDQDKNGEQFVIKVNRGFRSVPTIIFPDGSILVEPSNRQLSQKLQISEY